MLKVITPDNAALNDSLIRNTSSSGAPTPNQTTVE
jgi:hypothetical protein